MNPRLLSSAVALAVGTLAGTTIHAATLPYVENFETHTITDVSNDWTISGLSGSDRTASIQTVDGSKALRLEDKINAFDSTIITAELPFSGVQTLQSSFDIWLSNVGNNNTSGEVQFNIYGTVGGARKEVGRIVFVGGGKVFARLGSGTGSTNTDTQLLSSYSLDTKYSLSISLDATTDQYSVSLNNGTPVQGNLYGNQDASDFTSIRFATGGAAAADRSATYSVDNISVAVPEPALGGLGLLASGFLLARRRRRAG